MLLALLLQVALVASPAAPGGDAPPDSVALAAARNVHAIRAMEPVRVDGILDDSVWTLATPVSAFVQREPKEGAPATERTEVRVVFDNGAIYIGAEMFDAAPDSIVTQLARRDNWVSADRFYVYPRSLPRQADGLLLRAQCIGRAVRRHAHERRLGRQHVGRSLAGGGAPHCYRMDGGDADSLLAAPVQTGCGPVVGHQLRAGHRAEKRAGLPDLHAEQCQRFRVALPGAAGDGAARPATSPRAAALCHGTGGVRLA